MEFAASWRSSSRVNALLGVGQQVFVGDIGAEEGGVVGVERDQQAGIEVAAQRVSGEGRADAGADI